MQSILDETKPYFHMAHAAAKAIPASTARFMSSWMRAASPSTYTDFCFGGEGAPLLLRYKQVWGAGELLVVVAASYRC